MKSCQTLVLILLCLTLVSGKSYWHRSRNSDPVAPEWDKLSVTWLKWEELPMTVSDAVDKGWTLQDKCQESAYYRGNRYVRDRNVTVMLLFDENDKIAGIQTGIAKSALDVKKQLPWREENGNFVITAYFKDPSIICSHRPSQAKYIGDRLLIQKSSRPHEFIHVPLLEDGLFESSWTEGECFWSMGRFYFDFTRRKQWEHPFLKIVHLCQLKITSVKKSLKRLISNKLAGTQLVIASWACVTHKNHAFTAISLAEAAILLVRAKLDAISFPGFFPIELDEGDESSGEKIVFTTEQLTGKLYWYDLSNVSDCDSVFPVFLMFTNGVLNGFGWILPYKIDNPRFIHPTKESFPYLFKNSTVPNCFWNAGYLSLMHVYLDSNPFFNIC